MIRPGDEINLAGYEVVAHAKYDRGDLLLVHNNSTHYLVIDVESGFVPAKQSETIGELLYSIEYAGVNAQICYRNALLWMSARAANWSSSLAENCDHDWNEAEGEPPYDVCFKCGEIRY